MSVERSTGHIEPLFVTLARPATSTSVIAKSVFLATLTPISALEDLSGLVQLARKTHADARHVCSAAVAGAGGAYSRSNDDGEPAGTAGAPMLQTLLGSGLTNVGATVTRWFGGTKLGTGGLVRAYSGAVHDALAAAKRTWVYRSTRCTAALDPVHAARIDYEVRAAGLVPRVEYGVHPVLHLDVLDRELELASTLAARLGFTLHRTEESTRALDAPLS